MKPWPDEFTSDVERRQLFLWNLPHWADESKPVYGSLRNNQIVAVHGATALDRKLGVA